MRIRRLLWPVATLAVFTATSSLTGLTPSAPAAAGTALSVASPIKHVVVIFQENHTFDNVLGQLCVADSRCDGATSAKLLDGSTYPLTRASDIIPNVSHSTKSQNQAIDNGKMDGWQRMSGCGVSKQLACLTQYAPEQVPNLSALARQYAISDRTFELDRILSFGAHVELATTDLDGFSGGIPQRPAYATNSGPGWGCNSYKVTPWRASSTAPWQDVPGCIPYADGTGSWWDDYGPDGGPRTSPVPHVGNIFDNLDQSAKTWKVYNTLPAFDVCSYFATCAHSVQKTNVVPAGNVVTDARAGNLANLSLVMPNKTKQVGDMSQHNKSSMAVGDNWIGDVVRAVQAGPNWSSTAIFITYDDCGCFYDHVVPPTDRLGLRLPMVIVSPYVKPGFTDSNIVSFAGMLAFTEKVFGLPPLTADDATSYDYMKSFDFTAPPRLSRTPLRTTVVPERVLKKVRAVKTDLDDPEDVT